MVLAAGLGPAGYAFAIMHLLTHGFFKAGLFLGAGSVMHAMNDDVDMRRYGALRTALPITFATFGLGYLAIIGVPPLAGFFSKEAFFTGLLTAVTTAFPSSASTPVSTAVDSSPPGAFSSAPSGMFLSFLKLSK